MFAMVIRLAVLAISQKYIDPQRHHFHSKGYEAMVLAHALTSGHGYSFPFPNFVATGWVAPVYVWILCPGALLFGKDGAMVVLFSQISNIIFSGLTCYPIYLLGKRIAGRTIGLAAAWTWVFLPVAVLMPIAYVWDQSLAALFVALLFALSYTLDESSSPWLWAGYGLVWGFAALTNPSIFVLFPCFAVWFWLRWQPSHGRRVGKPLALAALACILVLLPWTIRNWYQLGGFTFVKSNFGVEFWLGNNSEVKNVWTPARHPLTDEKELDRMLAEGELKYNREKESEALAFIKAHPATFVRLSLNRVVDTWTAFYDSKEDYYIQPLGIRPIYILLSGVFSITAVTGLAILLARNWLEWLPLAWAAVAFPLPYYLTHSSGRYRHPIDPILTVLAVVGVARIVEIPRQPATARGRSEAPRSEVKVPEPASV